MIRFLQKDNRLTKILFGVIIGVVTIGMVVYLIPGLMDAAGTTDSTAVYATVHTPGAMGRIFGESDQVKMDQVTEWRSGCCSATSIPTCCCRT